MKKQDRDHGAWNKSAAKRAGRPEDRPQASWITAEVAFDKHGKPFDAEAAVRQAIVNYHQNGEDDENE